jgi:hypothetical protein
MERMMDGGSGGYGTDPMGGGSEMGMPGVKPATRKKASGGKKRGRKKASKAGGRAKGKARGKARGRTRARAKKSKKARRR